jgi:hypothetical protein
MGPKRDCFVTSATRGANHPPSRGLFLIRDEERVLHDVRVEVGLLLVLGPVSSTRPIRKNTPFPSGTSTRECCPRYNSTISCGGYVC